MDEVTRQAFTDAWNLCKKYFQVNNSDSYWESFQQDAETICSKYQDTTLIRGLIQAVIAELERKKQ